MPTVGAMRLVNFTFKTGRNYDELANALIGYRNCDGSMEQVTSAVDGNVYVEKFDILWSAFTGAYRNIYRHLIDSDYWLDETRALNASQVHGHGLAFLEKYEADMNPDGSITCDRINEILSDIYLQKAKISEFGQSYIELDNRAAHEQQRGIANLYSTIVILGASFLLAALVTGVLVNRALKEVSESAAKSRLAEKQALESLKNLSESKVKNLAQKQFFAAASHDLRQPLHALGLYIGSLHRHVETEEAKHVLKCANMSAESLSALIDSLLDLSKLDAGVVELNKARFVVADMLAAIHSRFLPEAEEKGLEFKLTTDGSRVFTDAQLLDRMVQNLIVNALAYTREGTITLDSRRVGAEVVISISDTGKGIPVDLQKVVFNEFYRLDENTGYQNKGLGLGLSIVKRLSELLGVPLEMQSTEKQGTSISIKVPLLVDQHQVRSSVNVEAKHDIPAGVRVLIIDDEVEVRDSTAQALRSRGCIVRAVEDTENAISQCEDSDFTPQVIVCDYRLREVKTGVDAIKAVRRKMGREIPAILVTGDTTIKRSTARNLGNFKVLFKPISAQHLIMQLARLVDSTNKEKVI